ncbi:MAG: hypothetical protein M1820_006848 [Bogoriella megaspora]|nr:MAG: hypothetical protein M1820_006848 [Bogoriella megaspora]
MKTVPTFCATGTIVGVSAVGYTLGRPENTLSLPRPSSAKRKYSTAHEHDHDEMNRAFSPQQTPSPQPYATRGTRNVSRPSSRRSHQPRPLSDRARWTLNTDSSARQSLVADSGQQSSNDLDMDKVDPRSTLRSRPSWLKRLSSVSSSHESSPPSSIRPASPSIFSNGSTSFSNAGSTAPMLGKGTPSPCPLPPNKLVKRSASFRDPAFRPTGSKVPTLRRPVTSHQRSATLQNRPSSDLMSLEDGTVGFLRSSTVQEPQPRWRLFFGARMVKDSESRKRHRPDEGRNIRRVIPEDKYQPTLLLAKTIQSSTVEVDTSSQDGDSVFFGSRPATPAAMAPFMSSSLESRDIHNVAASDSTQDGTRPRRSFSIGDYVPTPPQLFRFSHSSKASRSKLLRRGKRVSSAPNPSTMGNWFSASPREDLEPPTKRREVSHAATDVANDTVKTLNAFGSGKLRHASTPSPFPETTNGTGLSRASTAPKTYRPISARQSLPSPTNVIRPSLQSIDPSERGSTLVGSDNENRVLASPDEEEFDGQSDTAYDSVRTGVTKSSSGVRGPRLETIFNDSPPPLPNTFEVHALRDMLPKGTFQEQHPSMRPTIAEEEESTSTPIHTSLPTDRHNTDSPGSSQRRHTPPILSDIPSSPPEKARPLSLGTLEWDPQLNDDESMWSIEDDEGDEVCGLPTLRTTTSSLAAHSARLEVPRRSLASASPVTTPQKLGAEHNDKDARSNIFDWSEQPADRTPDSQTPPRPRTVHGKKDAETRGSRSVGRRVPSAVHARSQSVPVVPDTNGKREQVVMNKFGTWGVGSKGVSEDWNDDFDFTEPDETETKANDVIDARADSGMAMFVPHSIREQQSNVLANIGLLREWGLLIEELKELRIRAVSIGMLNGPHAETWKEVDAMIELADQEAEDRTLLPRRSLDSSPGNDMDAFDDVPLPSANHNRKKRRSGILPEDDVFNRDGSATVKSDRGSPSSPSGSSRVSRTRPRKDSEAVAKSVIEALQRRRHDADIGLDLQPVQPSKKVPFDTATLKHIVPYVNGLMRKVKDGLREVEGLYNSPMNSPKGEEPSLMQIFRDPTEESPQSTPTKTRTKSRRSPTSHSERIMSDENFQNKENDLARQMRLMTVM